MESSTNTVPKCPSCQLDMELIQIRSVKSSDPQASMSQTNLVYANRFRFLGEVKSYRCRECGQILLFG